MAERIMAHLVAGFPDREGSLAIARTLIDGGCDYLEVQFPFSDPTADGPWIQRACDLALRAGFRLEEGFRLAGEIARLSPVPVFLMSYANPLVVRGVEAFVDEARRAGAAGPDRAGPAGRRRRGAVRPRPGRRAPRRAGGRSRDAGAAPAAHRGRGHGVPLRRAAPGDHRRLHPHRGGQPRLPAVRWPRSAGACWPASG